MKKNKQSFFLKTSLFVLKIFKITLKFTNLDSFFSKKILKIEFEIAKKELQHDPHCIQNFSPELRKNLQLVLMAVKSDGYALRYADPQMQDNPKVVLSAISQNPFAIKYASERLRGDLKIAIEVVQNSGICIQYLTTSLKEHPTIQGIALAQNKDAKLFINNLNVKDFSF